MLHTQGDSVYTMLTGDMESLNCNTLPTLVGSHDICQVFHVRNEPYVSLHN